MPTPDCAKAEYSCGSQRSPARARRLSAVAAMQSPHCIEVESRTTSGCARQASRPGMRSPQPMRSARAPTTSSSAVPSGALPSLYAPCARLPTTSSVDCATVPGARLKFSTPVPCSPSSLRVCLSHSNQTTIARNAQADHLNFNSEPAPGACSCSKSSSTC